MKRKAKDNLYITINEFCVMRQLQKSLKEFKMYADLKCMTAVKQVRKVKYKTESVLRY